MSNSPRPSTGVDTSSSFAAASGLYGTHSSPTWTFAVPRSTTCEASA